MIYSLLFYCLLPFILLRLVWRGFKQHGYWQRWAERFGFVRLDQSLKQTIWVHTVSVGEVLAAKSVIVSLLEKYPERTLVVTTMTPTGSEQVRSLFGDRVYHVYAPYDLPGSVKRFLTRVQPQVLLIMETEIWPNTIKQCHQRQIPIVLMNGRMSEKSKKKYQRFLNFAQSIFQRVTHVTAQTEADAQRFKQLGANTVSVTGSIKADINLSEELQQEAAELKKMWGRNGRKKIILAASTHRGEDEIILQAYSLVRQEQSETLLLLVPRHPDRFDEVEQLCCKQGFKLTRKSLNKPVPENVEIILGDTMGELLLLCGVGDIAIMGGTFIEHGGHNFLEPAVWGSPIVSGDSVYNFAAIAEGLLAVGALMFVESSQALGQRLIYLLENDDLRQQKGEAAKQYVDQLRGAKQRLMTIIQQYLSAQ